YDPESHSKLRLFCRFPCSIPEESCMAASDNSRSTFISSLLEICIALWSSKQRDHSTGKRYRDRIVLSQKEGVPESDCHRDPVDIHSYRYWPLLFRSDSNNCRE